MTFRSHAGSHPVFCDEPALQNQCINCKAPIEYHALFACPNKPVSRKALSDIMSAVVRRSETDLNDILKQMGKT